MKKILLVVIILIVAALGAAPYWFGMQAEKNYNAWVDRIKTKGDVDVISSQFHRGWIKSTAETTIELKRLPFPITLTHHISHGPYPLSDLTDGNFNIMPELASIDTVAVAKTPDRSTLPPAQIHTVIAMDGSGTAQVDVPAFKVHTDNQVAVESKGITGSVKFQPGFVRSNGKINIPSLHLNGQNGDVKISALGIAYDVYEGMAGISLGDFAVNVGDAAFTRANEPPVTLHGIRLTTTSRERAGALNNTLKVRLDQLILNGTKNGPGELEIHIRNIDAQTIAKLQQLARAAQPKKGSPPAALPVGAIMGLVMELAKHKPEVEITKLTFTTADGELHGKGKLVVDGTKPGIGNNPLMLLGAINADAELAIPESMVRTALALQVKNELAGLQAAGKVQSLTADQTQEIVAKAVDARLAQWATQNHFDKIGDHYRLVAEYRDGQLRVNGAPLAMGGAAPSMGPSVSTAPGATNPAP